VVLPQRFVGLATDEIKEEAREKPVEKAEGKGG